ncbi:unnamed protein product [Linum tenue]|uniref:Autophagy-related protein 13 N-terminal domain-containing protein n=1 Tax=Linum tenue TaxID=586396 RepID=A0AAV0L0Z1_9ROSI|nr:unnamed protein product [Linum tenue]
MASSHGNSTHSESAKTEQIITEFFAKSLHIILECRSPFMSSRNFSGEQALSSPSSSSSSSSSVRPRDKWFNLALGECPAALENLDLWRQSNFEPVVVDVILVKRGLSRTQSLKESGNAYSSDHEEVFSGSEEKIIERWIVQYDTRKPREKGSTSRRTSSNVLHTLYKKSILLLRSLYATVRLLPAYKIFRDLNCSGKLRPFTLTHRLLSFVEPFTRKEESEMQRFSFTPVDTSSGRLCLSVLYHSSVSDASSESSTPMSPQFIPDYVGSPLADPLKRFTSLPVSSPSSLPFSRRHSWSYDRYRASPPAYFSPSPTHSEPPAANALRFGPVNLPPQHPDSSSVHKTNYSYDEYYPSPNFTPSPSPSPPVYMHGNHLSNAALLRTESAPVCIPKLNLHPSLPMNDNSRPSRGSKLDTSTGLPNTGVSVEKVFFVKDDSKKHYGTKISTVNSSQFSISRSSSRSFLDDFDDSDFPCHFDVEDDDPMYHGSRPESFDKRSHIGDQMDPQAGGTFPIKKSQDAAVGALVHMLKKAPPLRQELSTSTVDSTHVSSIRAEHPPDTSSSVLVASKTTADALEELQGFKLMKDCLLSQGGGTCNVAAGIWK